MDLQDEKGMYADVLHAAIDTAATSAQGPHGQSRPSEALQGHISKPADSPSKVDLAHILVQVRVFNHDLGIGPGLPGNRKKGAGNYR